MRCILHNALSDLRVAFYICSIWSDSARFDNGLIRKRPDEYLTVLNRRRSCTALPDDGEQIRRPVLHRLRPALGVTLGGQLSKNGIHVGHGAVARTWVQRAVRTVRTVRTVFAGIFQRIAADASCGRSCSHAVRAVRV